jgi:hypothetical protein
MSAVLILVPIHELRRKDAANTRVPALVKSLFYYMTSAAYVREAI